MNISNKKILIGLIFCLFIVINIYNIPLSSGENNSYSKDELEEVTLNQKIDLVNLHKAIDKSSNIKINYNNYKSIVVTFWATWCPSCKSENKVFNEVTKKYKDILILGVCMDREKDALDNYLKTNKLLFNTFNVTKEISTLFDDIVAVPTHFIINNTDGSYLKKLGLLKENELIDLVK